MNWLNNEVDHVRPVSLFDVSKEQNLNGAFCWKNTHTHLKQNHQQKELNKLFLGYQKQFTRAYQFIKLMGKGHYEDFHR